MKNEFYSMIDALNFLGERGFELVLSEVQKHHMEICKFITCANLDKLISPTK